MMVLMMVMVRMTRAELRAECRLERNVTGTLQLTDLRGATSSGWNTQVTGTLAGLAPGKHGFHVHEGSTLECGAAGGHYNPRRLTHGDKISQVRHAGDMGNILA